LKILENPRRVNWLRIT